MKSPGEKPLLQEVLADEALSDFRRASLDRALGEVRRTRQQRRLIRGTMLILLPLAMLALAGRKFFPSRPDQPPALQALGIQVASTSTAEVASAIAVNRSGETTGPRVDGGGGSAVKTITDEELFALFPNRALALVGVPGRQRLVFLDATAHN